MSIFNISISRFYDKENLLKTLLVFILITLPLKNIFVSISIIGFSIVSFFCVRKQKNKFLKSLILPILFFFLMLASLLWTRDFEKSLFGIQKQLPLLTIPFLFIFLPSFTSKIRNFIFKSYSFLTALFAIYFFTTAVLRYVENKDTSFFFHMKLVPIDPGVIYMSVFASFALFYFIQIKKRSNLENIGLNILTIFIFLLSSKSIITIDFIIIVCYYSFFTEIPKTTKLTTITTVGLFLFLSIFFVKEVKERFMIEYETAFVDNTLNSSQNNQIQAIHTVSLKEAWKNKTFNQDDFFPGTALRIYQLRIFCEMLTEQNIFFNGFGLEASQQEIENKAKQYNLFYDYKNYNFHNQYVQTFAEIGFFGFFTLIVMLFVNLLNALKRKDFLHIAFAITMIMLFLSESFFCRQRGIVFFIVLYCLFNTFTIKEINNKSNDIAIKNYFL